MGALVTAKLYRAFGLRETDFEPVHVGGRLSNEFRCYAGFEGGAWNWRKGQDEAEADEEAAREARETGTVKEGSET